MLNQTQNTYLPQMMPVVYDVHWCQRRLKIGTPGGRTMLTNLMKNLFSPGVPIFSPLLTPVYIIHNWYYLFKLGILYGLTFSHRPDEANSLWSQQKLIFELIDHTNSFVAKVLLDVIFRMSQLLPD